MSEQILDIDFESEQIEYDPAGFWIRVGASLVDVLVYSPLIAANSYNMYVFKNMGLMIALTILTALYKPFMEYKYGATLGKMAVKIKLVDHKGQSITLQQAVVRYIPWIISHVFSLYINIVLFQLAEFSSANDMMQVGVLQNQAVPSFVSYAGSLLVVISCVVVAFNSTKQGLHDLIAGTFCVYKND